MRLLLPLTLVCLVGAGLSRVITQVDDTDNPEYGGEHEGDILIPSWETQQDMDNVSPLNAIWDKSKKWTNKILYYKVHEDYNLGEDGLERLSAAILDLVESVKVDGQFCIKILPRTTQRNYVSIQDGGCSSYIGMIGGAQRMKLSSSCLRRHGSVMHEFIHGLGFHHEQKRSDRDKYITINFDNISEGHEKNFIKLVEGSTVDLLGTRYDYGSIMHYSAYAFAVDRSIKTITTIEKDAEIGQREKLSDLDKERIQILYGCIKAEDSKYFKHLAGRDY